MLGKRKIMARIMAMASAAALMVCAGMVHADTGEWKGEHSGMHGQKQCDKHRRHHFKELAEKLGLTDAQKAQAKAIFQANRDVVKPMVASLRAERKNLRALIHADKVDEAAIRAETAKLAGIQADLNVNRAKVGAQFRSILTPAQMATLKTQREKHQMKDDMPAPVE